MYFAEFFYANQSPACGDRSVFILDGRNSFHTQVDDARRHGYKYGFETFRICKGKTFTRSKPMTQHIRV